MKSKRTRSTKPAHVKRYSLSPIARSMLCELAQQDATNGKRPKANMAATLYEVLQAELQRRLSPAERELARERAEEEAR